MAVISIVINVVLLVLLIFLRFYIFGGVASFKGGKIIVVDFDGVIHSYKSGWKGPRKINDIPVQGAITWLYDMCDKYQICIISARSRYLGGRSAMKKYLRRYGLTAHCLKKIKFPLVKPPASLTIDDRVFLFNGGFPSADYIDNFAPWYQKDGEKYL